MDKSLFIQELLISSIENFLKHDLKFPKGSDQRISFDQSGLDDVRPEGGESGKVRTTEENPAKATDENKAADENKAKASNETNKSEPQINPNESAASPNNHLPSGSDGPVSSSTNQSIESAKVTTNGVESTSQQTTESSHQSTNASSNNQELNHQIAKGEHSRAGEMAASGNSSEPVASNSVDHSNNVGNNVENASGTASTADNSSSNASDTAERIKPAPSNEPVEQPRCEQPPAK